ncbi:MAG: F0F1 ATP synthase subunit epsilon [Hyphomicrobiales bacterium]|nr:F0F1 ATP synthase subunit epsilon [Hyphomicrobiales bacterium]MBV8439091.1 F0F1 ATP synthase subunit epsilon [Hyphomicrobiales bacterium]
MPDALHLTVTTPSKVLVDAANVVSVRAEDQSGSFGILPGHTDFLTVLTPCVLHWATDDGAASFCSVRGGVFTVSDGRTVGVACRDGVLGDSLEDLEAKVRAARAQQLEAERQARVREVRAHAFAARQLVRYLRPGRSAVSPLEPGSGREQG